MKCRLVFLLAAAGFLASCASHPTPVAGYPVNPQPLPPSEALNNDVYGLRFPASVDVSENVIAAIRRYKCFELNDCHSVNIKPLENEKIAFSLKMATGRFAGAVNPGTAYMRAQRLLGHYLPEMFEHTGMKIKDADSVKVKGQLVNTWTFEDLVTYVDKNLYADQNLQKRSRK